MVCVLFEKSENFNIEGQAPPHHCSIIIVITLKSEDSKHKQDRLTKLTLKLQIM